MAGPPRVLAGLRVGEIEPAVGNQPVGIGKSGSKLGGGDEWRYNHFRDLCILSAMAQKLQTRETERRELPPVSNDERDFWRRAVAAERDRQRRARPVPFPFQDA